ncbi:uncharacterized [Tachysurus ichikawai]
MRMCQGAVGDGKRPEHVFDFGGCRIPLPSSIPVHYIKGGWGAGEGLQGLLFKQMKGHSAGTQAKASEGGGKGEKGRMRDRKKE